MNLLRVSITAASHKTFRRHILRYAVSSNINIMIRGFATAGENLESEKVVEKMNQSGDCVSYKTLISDMSSKAEVKGLSPNETTYTSLVDSLCKQDRIDEAYKVLNEMILSGFSPSFVTLNDVLRGFLRIGDMRKAFDMRNEMNEHISEEGWMDDDTKSLLYQGLSDEVTYTSMINAYLDEGNWDYADELYYQMEKYGRCGDPALYSVFINGLDDNKARTIEIKKELLSFNYVYVSLERPTIEYHRTLAENCCYDDFKSLVELAQGFCSRDIENAYDTKSKSIDKPNGIDDGIVYNVFIIEYCQCYNDDSIDVAYNMYKDMVHYGFPCHMFTVFALIKTLEWNNMFNELLWVIQNVLRSCNLNDSEILKFLDQFNSKIPNHDAIFDHYEALFDVLAEKAKDGLFLKCSYAPPSA